jgi:hypothetical protein
MSEKIIGLRLTDEDIRKLHLPVPGYMSSLNTPCLCPVCRPAEEEEEPDGVLSDPDGPALLRKHGA